MYVYDPLLKLLTTKVARGTNIGKFSVSPDKGIIGLVYKTQTGIILPSAYKDQRFDRSLDKQRKSITRDMMCVPLKVGGKCVGCLEIANKHESNYNEDDYQLASSIGRELAVGITTRSENNLASDFIQNKNNFSEKLRDISDRNLLSPLLKNILIILAEVLKSEKYIVQ